MANDTPTNVFVFEPKQELDAAENLIAFIDLSRNKVTAFGSDLPFADDIWDVSNFVSGKGSAHAVRLRFANWQTRNAGRRGSSGIVPLQEPFLSFSKAYIRYKFALSGKSTAANSFPIAALRALEAALLELTGGADPCNIDPASLNRAVELMKATFEAPTAYSLGKDLQKINDFATEAGILKKPTSWKSSLKPIRQPLYRVGRDFDLHRAEKMPSPTGFYALGNIFQNAQDAEDILVSSVCALLCCAPSRICEVVLLPEFCEVSETDRKTGETLYGLSWRPAKGGAPMVKFITRSMHDVARGAVQRLRELSAPARQLATWYERNPTKLFLPKELEHLRGKSDLTMAEVDSIVFADFKDDSFRRAWIWAETNNIPTLKKTGINKVFVSFQDVENAILRMLPRGFPFRDAERKLRYSESLILLRKSELIRNQFPYRCMLQPVEPQDINDRISKRENRSIFAKHGLTELDGSPIALSTHKFRHYLNTLAHSNNVDQLDIARWSGRQNVSQNTFYNHLSDREAVKKLRLAIMGENEAIGPIAHIHKIAVISRDQFARLRIPTAHTTEFGYCIHDFSMLPCQHFQDCVNCAEHACIKGLNPKMEANIRATREETTQLLARAKLALEEEVFGADKWVKHQELTLSRLQSLCAILDDPNISSGAVIQLDQSPTQDPLEQAMQTRSLADPKASDFTTPGSVKQ